MIDPIPGRVRRFRFAPGVITGAAGLFLFLIAFSIRDRPWQAIAVVLAGCAAISAWLIELRRSAASRRDGSIDGSKAVAPADYRSMLEAVADPLVTTDASGRVVVLNAGAEALVGRPAAALVGRPVEEVFTQAELLDLLANARRGRRDRAQVRVPRPDGARVYEVAVGPVPGAGSPSGVVMTMRDATEIARAVQVKTDFVANASHELRTPIASLRAAAETLDTAADDPAMLRRATTVIASQVDRLEELVRDLLDLSRLESPELRVRVTAIPGAELIDRLSPAFEGLCRKRSLTLAFDLSPELARLRTDRTLLFLVLTNLIENATKFAYEGTTIRVTGRPISADEWSRDAEPGAGPARTAVRFEVTDRGVGIPYSQVGRIFERFYQVNEARPGGAARHGSGLGLAIVKHAVRTLGGQVRVRSVWKEGTTFTVDLPDALAPA